MRFRNPPVCDAINCTRLGDAARVTVQIGDSKEIYHYCPIHAQLALQGIFYYAGQATAPSGEIIARAQRPEGKGRGSRYKKQSRRRRR